MEDFLRRWSWEEMRSDGNRRAWIQCCHRVETRERKTTNKNKKNKKIKKLLE